MRSQVLMIGLWVSALACTPTGPDGTPAPTSASEQAAPDEGESGYTPRWSVGQTWGVSYDTFMVSMDHTNVPMPTEQGWRFEVVAVSDQGIANIRATSLRDDGTPYGDREWLFDVHASGQLIRAEEEGSSLYRDYRDGAPIYPLVPHIHTRSWGIIHLVPWWPRFPLVPGETQVFLGGAITQSVTEVGGTLRVELVAKPRDGDYPYRRVSMEWERGRPYWTRIEEVEKRSSEPPEIPFRFRGEVVTWDRSNPWPLPRDVELLEIVHP
jgi:hypothetical protein